MFDRVYEQIRDPKTGIYTTRTWFRRIEDAEAVAAQNNADDDGWTYEVTYHYDQFHVAIYDENREFIGCL